ncbi:MAG: hypothetical protein ACRDL5_07985, partial [Solirubrobacteraceae bacterium]
EPLGFVFEHDAVIVAGLAHRVGCGEIAAGLANASRTVRAGEAFRSEWCPRSCARCEPTFLTLLSYELGSLERRAGSRDGLAGSAGDP